MVMDYVEFKKDIIMDSLIPQEKTPVPKNFLILFSFLLLSSHVCASTSSGSHSQKDTISFIENLDGIWVSDLSYTEDFSGSPEYVLVVHDGIVKLDMIGYAANLVKMSVMGKIQEDKTTSQKVVEMGNDYVYMAWSNEQLKIPNQSIALAIGQFAGDVASGLTEKGVNSLLSHSFLKDIGTDILSGVASDLITGLVLDAFIPSKKIHILELYIQKVNETELIAHSIKQCIKIKGDNPPLIEKSEEDILFTKYDLDSGVYFDVPFLQQIYVPGEGAMNEIPENYQNIVKSYTKYYEIKIPTHISIENQMEYYGTGNPFNMFQNKKLQYFNEKKLLQRGVLTWKRSHLEEKHPYLGITIEVNEKGDILVSKVDDYSPAHMFGIMKGDIILSIDDEKVINQDQYENIITWFEPNDWTIFYVKRGRKKLHIPIELTWKYYK